MTLEWYLCRHFFTTTVVCSHEYVKEDTSLMTSNFLHTCHTRYEHRTPKKDWYDATIVIQDKNPGVHFIGRDDPPIHPKQADI